LYDRLRAEFATRPRVAAGQAIRWKDRKRLFVYVFATPESERERKAQEAETRKPEPQPAKPKVRVRSVAPPNQPLRVDPESSSLPEADGDPFGQLAPLDNDDLFDGVASDATGGFGGRVAELSEALPMEAQELLDIITTVIAPTDWEGEDGVFAKAVHRRIVIRHTNAVHAKVKELARRLRIKDFRELSTSGEASGAEFGGSGFF
jgi:hypothetical protein